MPVVLTGTEPPPGVSGGMLHRLIEEFLWRRQITTQITPSAEQAQEDSGVMNTYMKHPIISPTTRKLRAICKLGCLQAAPTTHHALMT